jgi:Domain of unknown function (DUF4331)
MTTPRTMRTPAALAALGLLLCAGPAAAADHNDPNAVNSIFADVPLSAADLYDFFGFPSGDKRGGERVVVALTFAPVPKTGVFDADLLYRLLLDPDPRVTSLRDDHSLTAIHLYARAVKRRFAALAPAEVRVKVRRPDRRAEVDFRGFPGGDFSRLLATNKVETVRSPGGHAIQVYIGGRDDAFFNDLPGFFRSINYAPQFYKVPQARTDRRELPIPKTLIELEGNALFNFDPKNPKLGEGVKKPLPGGELTWQGNRFAKDRNGNYRFVYSGRDAQAGRNINAIVLELPLAFVTRAPKTERVVSAWGESWVLKAARKIEAIPDDGQNAHGRLESRDDPELQKYKLVDTDGVPFADAALNERADSRQLGANNQLLARDFVTRFAHLGWGFGPSVSALGLGTCFDHDDSPVSRVATYRWAIPAFRRVKKCLFQELNMPDASWNPKRLPIRPKKPVEIFIPNVCAIDMDTTGTWPFGRRPEDQVATRFLSVFLDMKAGCGGKPCNLETLGRQALWNGVKIEPKTPPNPLRNDKPFLARFPYLADPW